MQFRKFTVMWMPMNAGRDPRPVSLNICGAVSEQKGEFVGKIPFGRIS